MEYKKEDQFRKSSFQTASGLMLHTGNFTQ